MRKSILAVSLVLGLPLAALAAVRGGSSPQTPQQTGTRAESGASAETDLLPLTPDTHTEPVEADEPGGQHRAHDHQVLESAWRAPLTWKCEGERAYLAGAMTFSSPTPERLGKALAEVTTKGAAALVMRKNGKDFLVALSATVRRANKSEAFPAQAAPSFVRLVDGFGDPPGISSDRFQPVGYLRLADGQKSSWLELRQINWRAVEQGGCGEISFDGYAQIPSSSWGVSLRTSAGPRALRDLLDPEHLAVDRPSPGAPAEPPPVTLHFAFTATPTTVERSSPRGPS
jgi:hypothetical protein